MAELDDLTPSVSTGVLPQPQLVDAAIGRAFDEYRGCQEGQVADFIPGLATADPDLFGIAIADVDGRIHAIGDTTATFSIQSISKVFVYSLVCELLGHQDVMELVGVNNTGLPFNSVMALELNNGHPMNPMVNAGAMATTGLVPAASTNDRWELIRNGLSRFAGRDLAMDDGVYRSETATNHRNQAIARLLESYGRIELDPAEIVDTYTRQCSLTVTAADIAVMGATLADGGANPVTGEQVVSAAVCRDTLAVMATAGMYERSGEWLFEIGLPGKSGVSGGVVTVAPGKAGIGAFSPRLDPAGNSVRGRRATAYLSKALGLDIFASAVHPDADVNS